MTLDSAEVDFSHILTEEVNPQARVQPRERNSLLHPGCCAMCGNATAERYIDPGIFYDYEGQVYFCWRCATEIGTTVGCLDPEQSKFLVTLNDQLATENRRLQDELSELAPIRSLVRDAIDGIRSASDPVNPEGQEQPDGLTSEPADEREADKPVATESVADDRSHVLTRVTSSNPSGLNI